MNKLINKLTKEWRWPKASYVLMEIFRDVTFHSRLGYTIFMQPPYSSWTTLVFLSPGKDALQSGSKPVLLGPWDSSCKFLKTRSLLLDPKSLCNLPVSLSLSFLRSSSSRLARSPPSTQAIWRLMILQAQELMQRQESAPWKQQWVDFV